MTYDGIGHHNSVILVFLLVYVITCHIFIGLGLMAKSVGHVISKYTGTQIKDDTKMMAKIPWSLDKLSFQLVVFQG